MADIISVEVKGLEEVKRKLGAMDSRLLDTMKAAGLEAAEEVIDTEGLRKYPPATSANYPPTPYYIRGRGMQYKSYNSGKSERYGTQFYTQSRMKAPGYATIVGNRASYAQYLAGEKQSVRMAAKGWKKLLDVAREKLPKINQIYNAWIKRLINQVGL